MKKIVGVLLALCMVMAFVACASKPEPAPVTSIGMPDWVRAARRSAPEDVLVGIGTAKMETTNRSMNMSETRARNQIVRAMESMVKNMVEDYGASSELDPNAAISFQQEIAVTLASATLNGATIYDQNADDSGAWWTVVYLNKTDVVREINQAQAAAKLRVPALKAFEAEARMDQRFKEAAAEEWIGWE